MEQTIKDKPKSGISSLVLHIIAMAFMLCDHMWATVIPGNQWLTCAGRLAFPIFAFMIAEGYYHTRDINKYIRRLLIFAVISEIPFNLTYTGVWIYPFHQNVLWTFILALLCIKNIDKIKLRFNMPVTILLSTLTAAGFMLAAQLLMTDYYGYGVLTVLIFHFFRGNSLPKKLGQLIGLIAVNFFMIKGMIIPVEALGLSFEFPLQGFAVFSLIPIWLYNGKQGRRNKAIQLCMYAFYPLHMLILGLI